MENCRKSGLHIEPRRNFDGTDDRNSFVVSFPCKIPDSTPTAASFTWRQQLDTIRRLQREWSDNSVSCTVTYKKEDLEDIKQYLNRHFKDEIKTVSFLLYNDHGFAQAPYETISKERYDEMMATYTPITSVEVREDAFTIRDCESGVCPIK